MISQPPPPQPPIPLGAFMGTFISNKLEKIRKLKKDEEREVPDPRESIEETPTVVPKVPKGVCLSVCRALRQSLGSP